MPIFDPSKYEDEPKESFVAPKGKYALYAHEQSIKTSEKGTKYIELKVTFDEGPRKGKWFVHRFFLWNSDKEKQKKALVWFGNFCRAIGLGAFDPEIDGDQMLNKIFIGDVDVESDKDYGDKNVLLPWGFHAVGESATSAKPSNSSAVSSASSGSDIKPHEDDIPF